MSARFLAASWLLAVALGALAACSDTGGPAKGKAGPSTAATATQAACPQGDRCYEFTDDSEGWPEVSDDQHFAGHDVYLDGSYRIGARQSGSWSLPAPLRVSDLSPRYGVQVDADATLGQGFPPDAAWGATCWTRDLGHGRVAGFGAYVQPDVLTVGIYDEGTGAFTPLSQRRKEGISAPTKKSHLTLRCRQVTSSGSAAARIEAAVGSTTVSVTYANSVKNRSWSAADGVGLLAAGKGADVFYDHVVVAPR